eukprot:7460846-Karenia_brevis.AAC.1
MSAAPFRPWERNAKSNAANYKAFMQQQQQQAAAQAAEPKPERQAESLAVVPRQVLHNPTTRRLWCPMCRRATLL